MLNRPPELHEFYKRHGKPLEVGMVVKFTNLNKFINKKKNEFEVESIKRSKHHKNIWVSLNEEGGFVYSPLDLEPIL